MIAPRFTPGEWVAGNAYGAARGHAVCAGHQVIARVTGFGYKGSGDHPESSANAALIAAAPELYAALDDMVHGRDGAIERARAALGKAGGA